MGKIQAAIFDMDGLLIDSEPLWQEAEKKIFSGVGIELTTAMCEQTMGLRIDEVVQHWYEFRPWKNKDLKELEDEVVNEVDRLIRLKGQPMPGVDHILSFFQKKGLKLAVASSAYLRLIETVLEKFAIRNVFEVVHSAEFEAQGKPHPAIYTSTAKFLNIDPKNCIAFEDSYNGLLSAKKANMRTVAVPDPKHFDDRRFIIADLKINSLLDFNDELLDQL